MVHWTKRKTNNCQKESQKCLLQVCILHIIGICHGLLHLLRTQDVKLMEKSTSPQSLWWKTGWTTWFRTPHECSMQSYSKQIGKIRSWVSWIPQTMLSMFAYGSELFEGSSVICGLSGFELISFSPGRADNHKLRLITIISSWMYNGWKSWNQDACKTERPIKISSWKHKQSSWQQVGHQALELGHTHLHRQIQGNNLYAS